MVQAYQPLYLKYRPQALSDLVGQQSVAQTLTNAIQHDRICHAYLFTGPRGTGKTSSARILAKSLNCESGPTAQPCLKCTSCLEVKAGNSPSVFEIDAASNNSVDDARALIERAPLVAPGGKNKLYIIDECHMLTKEAFNALLKTIEEPPPNVVFILATTEEHKVPPTIISRCQRLMFKLVNQKELSAHLRRIATEENINIDDDALALIARRSGGGLRDALGLLDQASLLSSDDKAVSVNDLLVLLGAVHEDVLLQISDAIQNRDGHGCLSATNALLMEGREPAVLVLELAKHFLNLTKASYINETGGIVGDSLGTVVLGSPSYLQGLAAQAKNFDRSELAQMVEFLDRLEQTCRRSSQPVLSVEMGLVALCHRHDMTYVRDLDQRLKAVEACLGDEVGRGPAPSNAPRAQKPVPSQPVRPQPSAAPTPASSPVQPAPQLRPSMPPPVAAPPPAVSRPASSEPITKTTTPNAVPAAPAPEAMKAESQPAGAVPESDFTKRMNAAMVESGLGAYLKTNPANVSVEKDSQSQPIVQSATPGQPTKSVTAQPSVSMAESLNEPVPADNPVNEAREIESVTTDQGLESSATQITLDALSAAAISDTEAAPTQDREQVFEDDSFDDVEPDAALRPALKTGSQDIDEFWSDMKEALQKRHIPTFSIVSVHAFPLSMDADNFVVGVRNETFQRQLENKIDHLKATATQVACRPINVRIKVVSDAAIQKPAASSSATSNSRPAAAPVAAGGMARPKEAKSSADPEDERATLDSRPASPNDRTAASATAVAERPARVEIQSGGSLINEAYKLFEGPGSRLIG